MGDREYLYELATVLDSAESTRQYNTPEFIRIDALTAKDIAIKLRTIADRMNNQPLH